MTTHTTTIEGRTTVAAAGSTRPVIPAMLNNAYSALTIPAYRRAIAFLSDALASFPRGVRKDGAKHDPGRALDVLLRRRPNGVQNAYTFWRTLFFHTVHTANGYARIHRDPATFRPVALHNVPPEDLRPFRLDRGDGRGLTQWYAFLPDKTAIPGADVIHLQGMTHDGMSGIDPIALHEATLQGGATLHRYTVQFLRKGTVIRGAVEVPGAMTPERTADLRGVLRQYQGGEGDEDVLILSDNANLNNQTLSPQESRLVEQTAASTKAIAQITGVPPSFLFELSEEKYRSTVEQDGQNVVRYCLRPWLQLVEAELTLKLLTDAEQDDGFTVHLNPDALLRGDTKGQMETVTMGVNAGVYTKNGGRGYLGLPPSDDPSADKLKPAGDTSPAPAAPTGAGV